MRNPIVLLLFAALPLMSLAHDSPYPGMLADQHRLFHEVTANFRYVDGQRVSTSSHDETRKTIVFAYYFDHELHKLFKCAMPLEKRDLGLCFDLDRLAERLALISPWSPSEMDYAKKNNLKPVDRVWHNAIPILEGKEPFSQTSAYVYYSGHGRVDRCRLTVTQYKFSFERSGQTVFIESNRKAEVQEECIQIYPGQ